MQSVPNQLLMRYHGVYDAALEINRQLIRLCNRAMDKIILQTRQEHQEK